jgi:hypothetical protein
MSLISTKQASGSHKSAENHGFSHNNSGKCPRIGGLASRIRKRPWLLWLLPVLGLTSLIWFLVRVVPKPSRAAYPCQRLAGPLAGGFVVWIAGLIGSTLAYRRARRLLQKSRYVLAGICATAAVAIVWWAVSVTDNNPANAAAFTPSEPANSPMGTAKGIHPGRVVWSRDPDATDWDGSTGSWWDDNNTDQTIVDAMISKAIQGLTGRSSDSQAWDALFKDFNKNKGLGEVGYRRPEKIAIKLNMNQDRRADWTPDIGNPSPHVVYSLVEQLINNAGVPGSAITLFDATRSIGDPIYNKIRSNPSPDFQSISFVVCPDRAGGGRIAAVPDMSNPLHTKAGVAYLPTCVTEAKYLINLALMRAHTLFGVTLCAKNHFGTMYFPNDRGWTPSPLHGYGNRKDPMGTYNCLVNLNGHEHLGGKTLLYMIDALYPARNQTGNVIRFVSFDNDWFSSIFVSQDMVAIDSVGLDFLRNEQVLNPKVVDVTGNPDNYLHEAALADRPPSGTKYDPEKDGTALKSLGVHEHWNNPKDRKYSRNLKTGDGIELLTQN